MGSVKAVPEAVRQLSALTNLHLAFHGTALTPTSLLIEYSAFGASTACQDNHQEADISSAFPYFCI